MYILVGTAGAKLSGLSPWPLVPLTTFFLPSSSPSFLLCLIPDTRHSLGGLRLVWGPLSCVFICCLRLSLCILPSCDLDLCLQPVSSGVIPYLVLPFLHHLLLVTLEAAVAFHSTETRFRRRVSASSHQATPFFLCHHINRSFSFVTSLFAVIITTSALSERHAQYQKPGQPLPYLRKRCAPASESAKPTRVGLLLILFSLLALEPTT